jgi:hypothetical protein
VSRAVSALAIRELLTRVELALETLAYSPLSYLTWPIAREHFVQFSCSESFKLYSDSLFISVSVLHVILVACMGDSLACRVCANECEQKVF